jgi:short subunit dehydrogenase-like uncharacterized protein
VTTPLLIYGATGYTGRLIVAAAKAAGLLPVLAGRNAVSIAVLASEYGLEHRVAALNDSRALDSALADMRVVLHCAGPFAHTAAPMIEACLRQGVHYLDITGELQVFEYCFTRDRAARAAGIMVLPGVGFDVVPSDCLAAHVASRMPGATSIALAFRALGGPSRGTATTMVENMGRPGAIRRDGRIVAVPAAYATRQIDFGDGSGPQLATTIPWGDVSTAYHSTGIGDVRVYMGMTSAMLRQLRLSRLVAPLLRTAAVQSWLKRRIAAGPAGPSDGARARRDSRFWCEARDAHGRAATSLLHTPNGYTITADAAVHIAQLVLSGAAPTGFQTPSRAYGAELVMALPGVTRTELPPSSS